MSRKEPMYALAQLLSPSQSPEYQLYTPASAAFVIRKNPIPQTRPKRGLLLPPESHAIGPSLWLAGIFTLHTPAVLVEEERVSRDRIRFKLFPPRNYRAACEFFHGQEPIRTGAVAVVASPAQVSKCCTKSSPPMASADAFAAMDSPTPSTIAFAGP